MLNSWFLKWPDSGTHGISLISALCGTGITGMLYSWSQKCPELGSHGTSHSIGGAPNWGPSIVPPKQGTSTPAVVRPSQNVSKIYCQENKIRKIRWCSSDHSSRQTSHGQPTLYPRFEFNFFHIFRCEKNRQGSYVVVKSLKWYQLQKHIFHYIVCCVHTFLWTMCTHMKSITWWKFSHMHLLCSAFSTASLCVYKLKESLHCFILWYVCSSEKKGLIGGHAGIVTKLQMKNHKTASNWGLKLHRTNGVAQPTIISAKYSVIGVVLCYFSLSVVCILLIGTKKKPQL